MERLRVVFAAVILAAWVASFFAPPDRLPDGLTPLMLLVAGYLFGPTITGRSHREARKENGS